ncbi:MAG: AMP-binding protein, partial [Thermoplasmata archaeon]|nr:AMP-binding protein [Thermoplasmata archaeon]
MKYVEPNIKDYDKAYAEFKWDVPEYYNFAWDVVDKWAEDRTKLAVVSVGPDGESFQKHSYWDLSHLSKKFARVAMDLGIKKGERVMVLLPRIPEYYIVMLGLIRIGAVPMPTPTLSTAKDIHYRINKAEAMAVVTTEEFAERVEEVEGEMPTLKIKILADGDRKGWEPMPRLMRAVRGDLKREDVPKTKSSDPFLIFFTSGTESYPKMVLHTQAYPIGHYATAYMCQDLHPTDLIWTIADTGWAKAAWGKFFGQFLLGASVLQFNQKGRFDPGKVLSIIENFGVTIFCAPPTAYRMIILDERFRKTDFSSLRHALSAGEPLNPEVIKVWREVTGLDIYDYYGQSETVAVIGNCRAFPVKYGSMGKPTLGHVVKILDDDGNEVPVGEEGNIAIRIKPERPPGLMKEYWKNPEANAKSFRGDWY